MSYGGMITDQKWPAFDEAKCVDETVGIAVQINGKLKGVITISPDAVQEQAMDAVNADEKLAVHLKEKTIVKIIFVKGKLINIVVK